MDGAATCWATDLAISDGCLAVETGSNKPLIVELH